MTALGTGGSSAFSANVAQLAITVTDVNDAPVLDNAGLNTLTAIDEDNFDSTGNTIADIIASSGLADGITDVDAGAAEGVAIFNAETVNGRWEYFPVGGTNWIDFGNPSASAALLLSDAAQVRFVPNADFNGCLLYTSPSPRDLSTSRMPSSA